VLAFHHSSAAAKTPHDQTVLQSQIAATDRQIDRLVDEQNGLTEEILSRPDSESRATNSCRSPKPYQVRQFLELVEQYNLELGEEG